MNSLIRHSRSLRFGGVAAGLMVGMLVAVQAVGAAGPTPIGLGTAASFAILAGTPAVTNTGATTVNGDLGISPAASVTGFPPGIVNGTIHAADAVALQAKSDLVTAFNAAAGLTPVTAIPGDTLGGRTLVGGVYGGGALDLTGTLTLDGQNDSSSVWVFQAASSLITASSSSVTLTNGADACNVFWQVGSSATLGSGSTFVGTIMALTSVSLASGVTVNGRVLARNGDVTLINDTITSSACTTAIPTPTPPSASPTPTPSASPTPTPSASPTPTPSASPTPSPAATPGNVPVASPTGGPTLPPTDTPPVGAPTWPGPGPLVAVGMLVLAVILAGVRRKVVAARAS